MAPAARGVATDGLSPAPPSALKSAKRRAAEAMLAARHSMPCTLPIYGGAGCLALYAQVPNYPLSAAPLSSPTPPQPWQHLHPQCLKPTHLQPPTYLEPAGQPGACAFSSDAQLVPGPRLRPTVRGTFPVPLAAALTAGAIELSLYSTGSRPAKVPRLSPSHSRPSSSLARAAAAAAPAVQPAPVAPSRLGTAVHPAGGGSALPSTAPRTALAAPPAPALGSKIKGPKAPPAALGRAAAAAVSAEASKAGSGASGRPPVHVSACSASCESAPKGWCHLPVVIPHVDWERVFQEDPNAYSRQAVAAGYHRYLLSQGLQVHLVQDPKHAQGALQCLRQSMKDSVLAIDLEWRPDFGKGVNKVAMLQLASATTCVLLHTASFNFTLPLAARQLLADPSVTVVGFAWDSADERKLQQSFKIGKTDFGRFLDLQDVAGGLGYPNRGLARLTHEVLGFELNKSKSVSRSNWARTSLSMSQIKYAAMDVFSAGQVFRGLRLWHSSPAPCPGCKLPVGAPIVLPLMLCSVTGRVYNDLNAYQKSCQTRGLPVLVSKCNTCGRSVPVASPPNSAGPRTATGGGHTPA